MGALGGELFFMSEVPLYDYLRGSEGVRFREDSEEEEQLASTPLPSGVPAKNPANNSIRIVVLPFWPQLI